MGNKRPLLLFSGGLDSTYCLLSLLDKSDVDLLVVRNEAVGLLKIKAEDIARKYIIDYCNRLSNEGKIPYRIRNINIVDSHYNLYSQRDCFGQPGIWMDAAIRHFDTDKHQYLAVGYCLGDQISAFLSNIRKWWKAMYRVRRAVLFEKVPDVKFPLMTISKVRMISILKQTGNEEVLSYIWTCELPVEKKKSPRSKKLDFIPCGCCTPCKNLARALEDESPMKEEK